MSKRNSSASFTGILFFAGLLIFPAIGKSYNLTAVNGMQAFQGSAAARELLGNLYMISPQSREEMMSRVRDWAKQQTR